MIFIMHSGTSPLNRRSLLTREELREYSRYQSQLGFIHEKGLKIEVRLHDPSLDLPKWQSISILIIRRVF